MLNGNGFLVKVGVAVFVAALLGAYGWTWQTNAQVNRLEIRADIHSTAIQNHTSANMHAGAAGQVSAIQTRQDEILMRLNLMEVRQLQSLNRIEDKIDRILGAP